MSMTMELWTYIELSMTNDYIPNIINSCPMRYPYR